MRRSRGFTLIELLVVVAIIALLVSILVPALGRARELAKRALCGARLNGIGKGLVLYGTENDDQPPILPDINSSKASATTHQEALKIGATCLAGNLGQGAQNNLCLLNKIGTVPWKMFLCPSTGHQEADRSGDNREFGLGESGKVYIDYGLQVPYKDKGGNNKCPWVANMNQGVVIMGDRAPDSDKDKKETYSPNHNSGQDGENILFAGGNVKFATDKKDDKKRNTCGWSNNNIYLSETEPGKFSSSKLPGFEHDSLLWDWQP